MLVHHLAIAGNLIGRQVPLFYVCVEQHRPLRRRVRPFYLDVRCALRIGLGDDQAHKLSMGQFGANHQRLAHLQVDACTQQQHGIRLQLILIGSFHQLRTPI